jgi:hypothetical protein
MLEGICSGRNREHNSTRNNAKREHSCTVYLVRYNAMEDELFVMLDYDIEFVLLAA